jgi:hypothetical protein
MLNSCAANVAVVNIDAGFKGGYLAAMIARRATAGRAPTSTAAAAHSDESHPDARTARVGTDQP